jgi:hypothetical protein
MLTESAWLQPGTTHQVAGAEVQAAAYPEQVDDRDVVLAALYAAHVRAVNASLVCQGFLRHIFLQPQRPDSTANRHQGGVACM